MTNPKSAYKIHVTGLVQGVGFRPFIYRIAFENNICGWVENNIRGVFIEAEGKKTDVENFVRDIRTKAPPASGIEKIELHEIPLRNFIGFTIQKSTDASEGITEISPDIAVCDDCLEDLKTQPNKIAYPFTNCTNCGPRFTIIKDLPYDRHKTTMDVFEMCRDCRVEYSDPLDRRFHAQPVACNKCGPEYELIVNDQSYYDFNKILSLTAELVESGKIVAIKGMGGFHLMCDATNEKAVSNLRQRKLREGKPFAVMFANIETVLKYADVSPAEKDFLHSWKRPIVLLLSRHSLAPSVNTGFHRMGVMLPYMPFHHQLFEKLKTPAIVLTSGNISDEPIILNNQKAIENLSALADAFLIYNREIYNRTDDSVGFVVNEKPTLIRRSRGFVPTPIRTKLNVDGIFAAGAELVNCFAVGKENLSIMSQHIGDLKNFDTYQFYEETIGKFQNLFRVNPTIAAVDLHPDYFSTRFGRELGIEIVEVQHHHAHIASCMAEHGLDEKVIGVSFDGTGLGDDGNIWGGEFFVCDLNDYKRFTHFDYIPMPGGDKVTKEPWRTAISYLYHTFGNDFLDFDLKFLKTIPKTNVNLILEAVQKNINSPLSSSCGRLFDAVSAMINLCTVSKFHAEAPMRLESIAQGGNSESYSFGLEAILDFRPTIREIVTDLKSGIPASVISAKFHNTMVKVIVETTLKIHTTTGLKKVVLSGGSFQNAILLGKSETELIKHGFGVFTHEKVPANDGGIALGQLVVAAKRRNL
ncbi:MAG: carbamoyltransferase HypF [Bacteroidales bacterium]|nr:carbamoyltransferase HypF [Bacteroidales bacterium]